MWEKEKISNRLSVGLIALVFIFLSLQFAFFVAKVIEIRKYNKELAAVSSEAGGELSATGGESSVAAGGGPATEFGQNQSRKSDGGQHESSLQTDTSAVQQRDLSGVVARTFSLEKLPPRPVRKPKPKVELNSADTTALMTLYGIGGYYARKIVEFRERLGGSFASEEQLMDIYGIDSARFVGFADRVYVDTSLIIPLDLYHMPVDSMARHPYIGKYAARGIDRYRRTVDSVSFTLDALLENGILQRAYVQRLKMYQ